MTTSWHGALVTVLGNNFANSLSLGIIFNFPNKESCSPCIAKDIKARISCVTSSKSETPKAIAILFSEPKALINTGISEP